MKIGLIHPCLDILGGAEQTTYALLDILKDSRHKVTLYTTTSNAIVPNQIKVTCIKKITFPIGCRLQNMLEIKKIFKKAENEDVLFISSGGLALDDVKNPIVMYCHAVFKRPQKNLEKNKSVSIHGIYNNYIRKRQENQLKILEKESVHLIANSNYTKEEFKETFGKKSRVIFPPVDMNQKKRNKNLKRTGVITVTRFAPEKNIEFNLKVVKKIDTTYKVFGSAMDAAQLYYNDLLKKMKNKKQISFLYNVDRRLKEDTLYESKVYFMSSKETFGISVIEGIMAGCIPIVPDNTANKETVPIKELRYREGDVKDAEEHVRRALDGNFDKYLDRLQTNVEKFSTEQFQKNIMEYLDEFEKDMTKKR